MYQEDNTSHPGGSTPTREERTRAVRRYAERRENRIIWGRLTAKCGLMWLTVGRKIGKPASMHRARKPLIQAVDYFQQAGMHRKAEAISRLLERCRRAWMRHEESEGFR